MHWSDLRKHPVRPKKSDLIDVEILRSHEDGKIDLREGESDLLQLMAQFEEQSAKGLEELREKNKESLGY
ncbi:hypothetical protein [Lactococcus termiticola]|uniref:hypothetical protein n=1 Tax=Lactococcus termiticola TaxID=2169526 RepID=UPI000D64E5EC|nr:hypothetical protein [Lactococcus termiticola]